MSPEGITAIFAGLVALIGAIAAATSGRARRRGDELRDLQRETRELRNQQRLSDQYLGRLTRLCDYHGIALPKPPEGLFDDPPHDDRDPAPAPSSSAGGHPGRRRRAEA